MKKLLFPLLLSLPNFVFAQVNDNRNVELIRAQFDRLHHHASINCEYKWWLDTPPVETLKQEYIHGKSVSAQYKISDTILDVEITAGPVKGTIDYEIAGTKFQGSLSKYNYIHLDLQNINNKQQEVINKYKLNSLTCTLEIAYEDTYVVEDKNIHVAMHPYTLYDLRGASTPVTVAKLADKSMHQLLLLDDVANIRKGQELNINEFLMNGAPDLPIKPLAPTYSKVWQQLPFDIPENIAMRVAPAGHLRFSLTRDDHEFTYTGGNHNYCIMNSTRRVLNAFFEQPRPKKITFNYVKDGIVVQYKSYLKVLNIPKKIFKKSNLLSNIIANMDEVQKAKYFDGHLNYYANTYLSQKQYMFGTATLIRSGVGPNKTIKVQGKGKGDITIIFNYI